MKQVYECNINEETIDYVQRSFYEYTTRKDIINTIFEMHKFDSDASVLESEPFKRYEKLFSESKVVYDTAMKMVNDTIIPPEYQSDKYRFEVDFDNHLIKVYGND